MTSSPTPAVLPDARALVAQFGRQVGHCYEFGTGLEISGKAALDLFHAINTVLATPPASDAAVPAGEVCDLCNGGGRNNHSQLWPDYPPACRACNGTGRLAAAPKVASESLTANTTDVVEGVCLPLKALQPGYNPLNGFVTDNLPRWILDGWTDGNEQWEEASEPMQDMASSAARAVIDGIRADMESLEPDAPKVASDTGAGNLDWRRIAKLAGEHGIRYRTNAASEKFLEALATPTDATDGATGGGEGFLEAIHEATPAGEWITVRHTPNGDWAVRNPPHKAFGGYGTDVDMGEEWTFTPDDREKAAILSLCADQELSPTAVMRQALRLYQHDHCRRKDGETVTWSGDDQRARDFAGPLATTPGGDLLEQAAGYLSDYARFIRDDVKADDLERHPYLPALEQTVADLIALKPAGDGGEA